MEFMKRNNNLAELGARAAAPRRLSVEEKLMLLQLLEPEAWNRAELCQLATDYDPRVRKWARLVLALARAGARREAA